MEAPNRNWLSAVDAVDVVVMTATHRELQALLSLEFVGQPGGWRELSDAWGLPCHCRDFATPAGHRLRVVAARAPQMGETSASIRTVRLVADCEPRCVAMCGVCAGNRERVARRDLIVADRLFKYDYGKLKDFGTSGALGPEVLHDITTYALDERWALRVEAFADEWTRSQAVRGLAGRSARGQGPKVHLGPIATGSMVIEEPRVFDWLEKCQRKTLGLEMEASAIGALASMARVPWSIVVKAVTDFADRTKNDDCYEDCARLSARFLLDFLMRMLPPPRTEFITGEAAMKTRTARIITELGRLSAEGAGLFSADESIVRQVAAMSSFSILAPGPDCRSEKEQLLRAERDALLKQLDRGALVRCLVWPRAGLDAAIRIGRQGGEVPGGEAYLRRIQTLHATVQKYLDSDRLEIAMVGRLPSQNLLMVGRRVLIMGRKCGTGERGFGMTMVTSDREYIDFEATACDSLFEQSLRNTGKPTRPAQVRAAKQQLLEELDKLAGVVRKRLGVQARTKRRAAI